MIRPPSARNIPGLPPIPGEPPVEDVPKKGFVAPVVPPPTLSPEALEALKPSNFGVRSVLPGGEAADRFQKIISAANDEANKAAAVAVSNVDGIFYRDAPVGWEDAGQAVVIQGTFDPRTGREQVLFQIDPTAIPRSPDDETSIGLPVMNQSQALKQLFMLSPTDQAIIKSKLVQVGLLAPNSVGPSGVRFIDDTIRKAWLDMVGLAQVNGRNTLEMLTTGYNEGLRFGPPEAVASAPTISVPSSDDIKRIANALSQREIGRRLTVEELDLVVKPYQQKYAQQQRRSLGGGTVEVPPSVESFTEGVIGEQAAEEQGLYSLGSTLSSFMGMLGGGS